MTKTIRADFRMKVSENAGHHDCGIWIDDRNAPPWYMGVSLVRERLVDTLIMAQKTGGGECIISREDGDVKRGRRSIGLFDQRGLRVKLKMIAHDLDYDRAFQARALPLRS